MYDSGSLEYMVSSSYSLDYRPSAAYFSRSLVDKYGFIRTPMPGIFYAPSPSSGFSVEYDPNNGHSGNYFCAHSFSPLIFLSPSRPKARFVDGSDEAIKTAEEVFELMNGRKLPSDIAINVLTLNDFQLTHSQFGAWSRGILGFSISGKRKLIFVKENSLDELLMVIGHEIGHVLTETLPNRHDEEAKAFAFSVEWAKTIKNHNVANLGLNIKDCFDFRPAKNGLHDVSFSFVDFMIKKGRKALQLHDDLIKRYISVFDRIY